MCSKQLKIFKFVTYSIPFKSSSASLDFFKSSLLLSLSSSPDSSSDSCSSSVSVLCSRFTTLLIFESDRIGASTVFCITNPAISSSCDPERVLGLSGWDSAKAVIG